MLIAPLLAYVAYTSATSEDLSGLEQLVWNLYTFSDAVILSLLLHLVWLHWKGQLQDFWIFVAASMAFMTFGDMLYTVYDAAGEYYVGSLPDVFYVSTYVVLATGFGMLVRAHVKFTSIRPTAETQKERVDGQALAPRNTFVVWGTDAKAAYELMRVGINNGLEGLIVARKHPNLIKSEYGLKKTPVIWLSSSAGPDTINPSHLGILTDTMTRFFENGSNTIVLLDGFETLATYSDFRRALMAMDHLKDVVTAHSSRLIIPVDRRALSEKEAALLEKRAVVVFE